MATGDRIAIADKATLDTVNGKLTTVSTNVANAAAGVVNANTKLDSLSTNNSASMRYLTPTSAAKIRNPYIVTNASSTTALNVSGKGVFYYFVYSSNNNNINVTINLDGTVLLLSSLATSSSGFSGLVYSKCIEYDGTGNPRLYTAHGPVNLSTSRAFDNSISSSLFVTYTLPAPIRFERNLTITVSSPQGVTNYIYYTLD